jgi:D-alanyl-D-alanine carboxypeptidase
VLSKPEVSYNELEDISSDSFITSMDMQNAQQLKSDELSKLAKKKEIISKVTIASGTAIKSNTLKLRKEMEVRLEEILRIQYSAELSENCRMPFFDKAKELQYINYKLNHSNCSWEEAITFVNIGIDNEFYTNVHDVTNPNRLVVLVNKYNQLSSNYIPGDLEVINHRFNSGNLLLRHEAREAFEIMCCQAQEQGICLEAISTFRSYTYQNQVYNRKMTADISIEAYQAERDRVSARAGHSEHQTGLAVDINDLEQTFEDTSEGRWLAKNSFRYGFILRYPKGKEAITGYDYEPWHFRYLGLELAGAVYHSCLTYDEFYERYLSFPIRILD